MEKIRAYEIKVAFDCKSDGDTKKLINRMVKEGTLIVSGRDEYGLYYEIKEAVDEKTRCENEIKFAYENRSNGMLPGSFEIKVSKRAEDYIKSIQKGYQSFNDVVLQIVKKAMAETMKGR